MNCTMNSSVKPLHNSGSQNLLWTERYEFVNKENVTVQTSLSSASNELYHELCSDRSAQRWAQAHLPCNCIVHSHWSTWHHSCSYISAHSPHQMCPPDTIHCNLCPCILSSQKHTSKCGNCPLTTSQNITHLNNPLPPQPVTGLSPTQPLSTICQSHEQSFQTNVLYTHPFPASVLHITPIFPVLT
jgi:hypothetical protein